MFRSIYTNRPVLVTGHTGFKGSWMRLWLERLGATVSGYALAPSTDPNHSDLLALKSPSTIADLRDFDTLLAHFQQHQPDIVFHLAAQASVLVSYAEPLETFSTNVMGTTILLEAALRTPSIRAVVVITTDKCYENKEWPWGYRENDALGGHDPYSTSKACAELVAASYRRSFCGDANQREHPLLIATARGGNVIGGGDWTADRLVPDIMVATSRNESVRIRNPESTRPWQHVLEPLAGYLVLGQCLLEGRTDYAEPWNFGPGTDSSLKVEAVLELMQTIWPAVRTEIAPRIGDLHEAQQLTLDSTKARTRLRWEPVWGIRTTLERTTDWYRAYFENNEVLSADQIGQFTTDAANQGASWAK